MNVHFIAIGGSAMHNLALALYQKGFHITGSDDEIFEPSRSRLFDKGLLPDSEGWYPEKIHTGLDAVILGMHARSDNPELIRAQELGIRIFSYPEYLYEQAKDKTRIVIGGSHGKTTITAMVLHAFRYAGIDTDYMVGAKLEGFDVMVRLSHEARFMVFEGDEYLTSPIDPRPKFHLYRPHIGLISGIAWDHINVFKTFEEYVNQFEIFGRKVEPGGILLCCSDDAEVNALAERLRNEVQIQAYGIPDYSLVSGTVVLHHQGKDYPLKVFGRHNLLNLNGAMAVCRQAGIPDETFLTSMTSFEGASNRLEKVVSNDHSSVYRDFAHAPSKVRATVNALSETFPQRRLVAVLELHTYSSLNASFLPQYQGSLASASIRVVYYNPHALQIKRLPDLSEAGVRAAFGDLDIRVFSESSKLAAYLAGLKAQNQNLLMMSSGNFDNLNLLNFAKEWLAD